MPRHFLKRGNSAFIFTCPFCHQKHNATEVKILAKKEEILTLYLNCRHCHSSTMMMVSSNILGMTSISILTDMSEQDLDFFEKKDTISANDVIEMHEFLETYKR